MAEVGKINPLGYPEINSRTTFEELNLTMAKMGKVPPDSPDLSSPPNANPAVARCNQAFASALDAAIKSGKSRFAAENEAEKAFRNAMPPLSGAQNIRDFIACVSQAMLLGALSFSEGSRLLYAAQVAYSTLETRSHHSRRQRDAAREQPQTAP
jgi:hypothetical protein